MSDRFVHAWAILISYARRIPRIPLSAFVVEDMLEYVHAHATYRFIVLDEEDEKPRLMVCTLFMSHAASF